MPVRNAIRAMIEGGPRLAVGRAREVAALLIKQPRKAELVVACLWDGDAGAANRAADALERASYRSPELLAPWKDALLDRMADATENKLRWNLALMIARVDLTVRETERAATVLRTWLDGSQFTWCEPARCTVSPA